MDISIGDLEVVHNVDAQRFEIHYGGDMARLEYRVRDSAIVFPHTVVPPALEGHGIAARLAKEALGFARDNGLSVEPLCPYVADYIEKHPEYAVLVAPER